MPLCSCHTITIFAMSLLSPSSLPQLPYHHCCHCIIMEALLHSSYHCCCHLIVTSHPFHHPSCITAVTMPSLSPSQSHCHAIVVTCCCSCHAIILSSASFSVHFPCCCHAIAIQLTRCCHCLHHFIKDTIVLLFCIVPTVINSNVSPWLPLCHCQHCHHHNGIVIIVAAVTINVASLLLKKPLFNVLSLRTTVVNQKTHTRNSGAGYGGRRSGFCLGLKKFLIS